MYVCGVCNYLGGNYVRHIRTIVSNEKRLIVSKLLNIKNNIKLKKLLRFFNLKIPWLFCANILFLRCISLAKSVRLVYQIFRQIIKARFPGNS